MKFQVTIDRDEDGVWITECPAIPGCVSQGDTKAEALKNIREAIRLCLEVRAKRGMPLSVEGSAMNRAQELQLQRLRMGSFNALDGDKIADDLLAHESL